MTQTKILLIAGCAGLVSTAVGLITFCLSWYFTTLCLGQFQGRAYGIQRVLSAKVKVFLNHEVINHGGLIHALKWQL